METMTEQGGVYDDSQWYLQEPPGEEPVPDAFDYEFRVWQEIERIRIREDARERFARERAGKVAIPAKRTMADLLAMERPARTFVVDRLLMEKQKFMLAAQHKAGKTTLTGNLIRAWADGDSFLGEFATKPLSSICLIDNEMGEDQLVDWYRALDLDHPEKVDPIDLRGRASSFNVMDANVRSMWAERLAGHDAVLIDCLRPFMDALGLDENRDAGRFLEAVDELMAEAGITTYGVVHHMGHEGQRARGDSRIVDWGDAIWNLRRLKPADPEAPEDDSDTPRFFSAYGRLPHSVREGLLHFEPSTRSLTYDARITRSSMKEAGASSARGADWEVRANDMRVDILKAVEGQPGITSGEVYGVLKKAGHRFSRGTETPILRALAADGTIRMEKRGNAKTYYPQAA